MGICLCVIGAFAFGHVYLELKDQLDVSSGAGVFVPTSAVDKVHKVCDGEGWPLGVLLSLSLGPGKGCNYKCQLICFLLMHV